MASQLVQMVTVVDRSGKAVNSSKHLVGVWKEAKAAYKERKAEMRDDAQGQGSDLGGNYRRHKHVEHDRNRDSSRRRSHRSNRTEQREHRHRRGAHGDRRYSRDRSWDEGNHKDGRRRNRRRRRDDDTDSSELTDDEYNGPHQREHEAQADDQRPEQRYSSASYSADPRSPAPLSRPGSSQQLQIQSSEQLAAHQRSRSFQEEGGQLIRKPALPPRPHTATGYDTELAYQDNYGTAMEREPMDLSDRQRLNFLVRKARRLLEEADCLHHSASKSVTMLQKNPDTMAAVGLTLAEISKVVAKMGPGVLGSIRLGAPAVFALLISPQFLVAGGIAVGVTVVAFGGYKIVKRIKTKKALSRNGGSEEEMDEALELDIDLDHIKDWRRGVNEEDLMSSAGTSVDGELITPMAMNLTRLNLAEASEPQSPNNGNSTANSPGLPFDRPGVSRSSSKLSTAARPTLTRDHLALVSNERPKKTSKTASIRSFFQ